MRIGRQLCINEIYTLCSKYLFFLLGYAILNIYYTLLSSIKLLSNGMMLDARCERKNDIITKCCPS